MIVIIEKDQVLTIPEVEHGNAVSYGIREATDDMPLMAEFCVFHKDEACDIGTTVENPGPLQVSEEHPPVRHIFFEPAQVDVWIGMLQRMKATLIAATEDIK